MGEALGAKSAVCEAVFRRDIVSEKGFFIRPSELFVNVRARAPHNENLNETLSMVFANIERSSYGTKAEKDMKGLFADIDVNSPKLGNTVAQRNLKLVRILDAIGDMDLSYGESTIDAFGDAYESGAHWDFEPFDAIVSKRWLSLLIRDNAECDYALAA